MSPIIPTPCDWGLGSQCATLARLDLTHNMSNFIYWQEAGYNQFGCNWFNNKINQIQGLPPTSNPTIQARRKSKIDYWHCMAHGCCGPSYSTNVYGCMDNGNMPNSYMNNRGTWNFQILNGTTTPGIVARTDGEGLIGKQTGSAYPGIAATNLYLGANVDDGSCFYASELPYMHAGCMDSTPHINGAPPIGNSFLTAGYGDVNGHGTAAVYDCVNSLTVPTIPDPCSAPGACVASGNSGYLSMNYDPCANFSCLVPQPTGPSLPSYASDMNWRYTRHEDGIGFGSSVFRPFGDTSCCNYTVVTPPPNLEYNYRYGRKESVGGCRIAGDTSAFPPNYSQDVIGEPYIRLHLNKFDVRLNRSAPTDTDLSGQSISLVNTFNPIVPGTDWGGPPACPAPFCPPNPYKITIYDLDEQLVGSWTYSDINGYGMNCNGHLNTGTGSPDCYFDVLLSNPTPDPGTPPIFDLNDNVAPTYPLSPNVLAFQTLTGNCPTGYPNPGPGVIAASTIGIGSGYPYYVLIENIATNNIKIASNANGWGSTNNLTNYAGTGVDMRFINSTNGTSQTPLSDFYYNNACCTPSYMGTCWFYEWFAELSPSNPSFSISCDGTHIHPWYESTLYPDCNSAAASCYGQPLAPSGSNLKLSGECISEVSNVLTIKI